MQQPKPPQPQLSDSQSSSQNCQQILNEAYIKEDQLEKALKTIAKIKFIRKDKLSTVKKKNSLMKNLFINMSDFFVNKHNKDQIRERKENRQIEKLKRREQRSKAFLKKHHHKIDLMNAIESSEQKVQPQIEEQEVPLYRQSHCYVCSKEYRKIDDLYHQHCPECAAFGKVKRFQSADLSGLVALVTGARIKIGYEIALKLLRDGAIVYATTRFTNDALIRYQNQKDYPEWKDRLFLIQCDFLSSNQVKEMISYIKQSVPRLDILINNAAQTLTRPKEFFTFQLQNQVKEVSQPQKIVLKPSMGSLFPSLEGQTTYALENGQKSGIDINKKDEFGQPIDLRTRNTWRQKIQDVSLFDCASTHFINSIVPFHVISELKSMMGGDKPSWIINVSSMEGIFYRRGKTCFHPHTNMAKAALNMITRTSSYDLARDNIFMNSVDTGWVTNQNPLAMAQKHGQDHDFYPPLDCIEGAMRVLDPIYQGVTMHFFPFGKFLKDYKESTW